jgi:hypothetical protein
LAKFCGVHLEIKIPPNLGTTCIDFMELNPVLLKLISSAGQLS